MYHIFHQCIYIIFIKLKNQYFNYKNVLFFERSMQKKVHRLKKNNVSEKKL